MQDDNAMICSSRVTSGRRTWWSDEVQYGQYLTALKDNYMRCGNGFIHKVQAQVIIVL